MVSNMEQKYKLRVGIGWMHYFAVSIIMISVVNQLHALIILAF